MKFILTRTSAVLDDITEKPCEGATFEPYTRIDERTVDDPMKNKHIGKSWYQQGKNHRVENGHIKRDFDGMAWFMEINSVDDLVAFAKKHGDIVVTTGKSVNPAIPRIEIYDHWRE